MQYEGVIAEHRAVRTDAGVFDVSHMGELEVEGPTARELLQAMLSNDVDRLEPGEAQYTLLTNETGGIVDDLIVYRLDAHRYLLVVNASNREADFDWLAGARAARLRRARRLRRLRAARRPGAARARAARARARRRPFTWEMGELDGVEVMINRTGYTGEEGVELACMADDAPRALGRDPRARRHAVRPRRARHAAARGLLPAARQRHRPAVGRDLVAGSAGRARSTRSSPAPSACARSRSAGPSGSSSPFRMTEKAIPRQGMAIEGGGEVTSGSLSPMLDVGIGLGYVPAAASDAGHRARRSTCAAGRAAREVVKKPIYKREETERGRERVVSGGPARTTAEHDWARIEGDEAVLGITWYAQDALGELVHYEPPDVGRDDREGRARTARSSRSRPSPT